MFDGAKMPAKDVEDQDRQQKRDIAKQDALDMIARKERGEPISEHDFAKKCQRAIRIIGAMIARLMQVFRELNITFFVAPYEADAQLAFLCRMGCLDTVISEDSDLLAYGCPSTFYKMDGFGNGELYALPCLQIGHVVPELAAPKLERADIIAQTLARWSPEKFTEFCVFCGTDYKKKGCQD